MTDQGARVAREREQILAVLHGRNFRRSVGLMVSSPISGLDVSAFTNLNSLCASIAATAAAPNVIICSCSQPGTVKPVMSAFVRVEA